MIKTFTVAAALATLAAPVTAATLFDSGPALGNANYCSSNTTSCGSNGWVIYSPFTLGASATVTGASYGNYGSGYVSTNWSIWASDPLTNFAGGPAFSGTAVGIQTAGGAGSTTVTFGGLGVTLGAGTYYFGLASNVSGGQITTYAFASNTQLSRQSDNSGNFFNPNTQLASFAIFGGGVPEPATWALMIGGFGMTGFAMRRRVALTA